MKFYVYQLRVEDEELPFYIGKSFDASNRLAEHFCGLGAGGEREKR